MHLACISGGIDAPWRLVLGFVLLKTASRPCRAVCPGASGLPRLYWWHVRLATPLVVAWQKLGTLRAGNGLYSDDPREFPTRLASNIGLDKFHAVIEIKIK